MYPTGTQGMLHCVGRLDRDSEGLLLLTSDGAFSRFATMPEAHLEKEYLAVTSCVKDGAPPSQDVLKQFQAGVLLHDGEARASAAEVVDFDGRLARLRLVVTEGRFRMSASNASSTWLLLLATTAYQGWPNWWHCSASRNDGRGCYMLW